MEVNVETVGENLPTENPDTAWENYLVNDYKKSNEQHQSDDVVAHWWCSEGSEMSYSDCLVLIKNVRNFAFAKKLKTLGGNYENGNDDRCYSQK